MHPGLSFTLPQPMGLRRWPRQSSISGPAVWRSIMGRSRPSMTAWPWARFTCMPWQSTPRTCGWCLHTLPSPSLHSLQLPPEQAMWLASWYYCRHALVAGEGKKEHTRPMPMHFTPDALHVRCSPSSASQMPPCKVPRPTSTAPRRTKKRNVPKECRRLSHESHWTQKLAQSRASSNTPASGPARVNHSSHPAHYVPLRRS